MASNRLRAQPFDCMQHFYSAVQEPLIRCSVRFSSHLNEDVLKRAVDLSICAVPLIGCCFDKVAHCWRKRGFTADNIVYLVEVHSGDDVSDRKLLLSSIDSTREPQLKIFIARGEQCDTLCIIISHMISDGAGFKDFLYLFGDLYSKCDKDRGYRTKPKYFGKRDLNQLLHHFSLTEKLRILFSRGPSYRPDPAMILPIEGDPVNPIIVIGRIEKERFTGIVNFAKSSDASVNDVILAAYIRILHKVTGCVDIAMPCPVNLRKYKKDDQTCGICNLTANYFCHVNVVSGESFGDTLEKVTKQMREQKVSDSCLKGPMLYHLMFYMLPYGIVRKFFYKYSPVPVVSYTNLGILDAAKFNFGNLTVDEAFISTAVKSAPYFQLSVSTYNGCCVLTSSLYATKEDRETVEGFFDLMENELESL